MILFPAIIGPANVQPPHGHLEILRQNELTVFAIEIDRRRRLDRIGNHLHPDPCPAIARHGDSEQAHLDEFMHGRRIEHRDHRRHEGMFRLMRHGRGFRRVVVSGQRKHAAMGGRAVGIGMFEHITGTIDPRPLAVPDADHPVMARTGGQMRLLRPPDGGRGKVFVDTGLKDDPACIEARFLARQFLIP